MSDANKEKSGEQGSLLHRAVQKIGNVVDGIKKDLKEAREHARAGEPSTTQPEHQHQHSSDPSSSSDISPPSTQTQSSKNWHWKGLDEEPPKPIGNPGWQGQQTETGHGGYGTGMSPKHATTEELSSNATTRPQAIDLHGQERGGGSGLGSPYTTGAPLSSTSGSGDAPKLLETPSSFAAERDFSANLSEYAKQQHIGSRYHDSASAQSSQSAKSSEGSQSSLMAGSSQSTRSSLSTDDSTVSTGVAKAGQSEEAPVESGFGGTIDNSSWRAGVAGSTSQLSSGPDYGDLKSPKNNSEMQE